MKNETIETKFQKEQEALNLKFDLKKQFFALCGIEPSIISPENNPFASFYPKNREEYLQILNGVLPTGEDATVDFSGKDSIQTFSPLLVSYGGEHNTPDYMDVTVKYDSDICPVHVKMPKDVLKDKFSVSTFDGAHKGFGRYERKYTLVANGGTMVQEYYGRHKTMYAATQEENSALYQFIIS